MKPKFSSPRNAFARAFLSGMAAPVLLFSTEFPRLHLDPVPPVNRVSDRDAMRSDWLRIGADFDRVIGRETTGGEQD